MEGSLPRRLKLQTRLNFEIKRLDLILVHVVIVDSIELRIREFALQRLLKNLGELIILQVKTVLIFEDQIKTLNTLISDDLLDLILVELLNLF